MSDHVALVIKIVRRNNGLTQAELAEELGVTPGHIGSLEQSRAKPSFEVMRDIVEKYNVDANLFFGKVQQDTRSIDEDTIQFFQSLLSKVSDQMGDYARSVEQAFSENPE